MSITSKLLDGIATVVTKQYKLVVLISIILFVLSIIGSQSIISKTQLKDLLPADDPRVQAYEEINDTFSGGTSVFITIEGTDKYEMGRAAERYVKKIKANKKIMSMVRAVNLRLEKDFLTKWGLLLQNTDDLENTADTLSYVNILPFLTALNDSFEQTYTGDEAQKDLDTKKQENEAVSMLAQLETMMEDLLEYLKQPNTHSALDTGKELANTFLFGQAYNYSWDDSMLLFSFSPNFISTDFDKCVVLTDQIKKVQTSMEAEYPKLRFGYAGDVPMQADEQAAMSFDMLVPTLIALVIILALFIFSFTQRRLIIFALFALVVGITANYGLVGVTINQVNMLTSIMAVLLLGLGIDYGIQIITNYSVYRQEGSSPQDAIRQTYQQAGWGTILAGLTTAIAFFVMAATGSQAFSQFGVVMGMGIITCLLSMLIFLPALLLWFGKVENTTVHEPIITYSFLPKLASVITKHRFLSLTIGVVLTLVFSWATLLNEWEYDLMALEPQHMTSIVQYKAIMEKFDLNPFTAMVIASSVEEAQQLTEQLENNQAVVELNSIAQLIPTQKEQLKRLHIIAGMKSRPRHRDTSQFTTSKVNQLIEQIQRLEYNVIEMGQLSVAGLGENNRIVKKRNTMIREILGQDVGKPGKEVFQRVMAYMQKHKQQVSVYIQEFDQHFAIEMDRLITAMTLVKRPITVADIPESVTNALFNASKTKSLITIFPNKNVMSDITAMQRFNDKMEKISPEITGMPQVMIAWMEELIPSSQQAAMYIFIVVFVFMILSFRSFVQAIIGAIPLLVGFVWMFGLYPLAGLKLNVINVAVIPLIVGMGIDFGIHLVHRYKVEQNIATVYRFTGKAVLLSALTTMIGFGSLALVGEFGSITSMGTILFFGIFTCMLTTLLLLPALLTFLKINHN